MNADNSILHKIITTLEHNQAGEFFLKTIRNLGFIHALHIFESRLAVRKLRGRRTEFYEFYKEHLLAFSKVRDLLNDDLSKQTFDAVLQYRMTKDIRCLHDFITKSPYFIKEIMPPSKPEYFIDGGAYIGDTAKSFLNNDDYWRYNSSGGGGIYLWEFESENVKSIYRNVRGFEKYVKVIPYAMWSREEILNFSGSGAGATITETGSQTIQAKSIDDVHKSDKITFIKMDIEGAEIEALKGAEQTIKAQKPKLAICIYHKPSHLFEIPLLIHEMMPEYKFYIRHHSDREWDTVLYATV